MTVAELIQKLQKFPPDMRVLTDGYEGGYDDPQIYETAAVKEYSPYCGNYQVYWRYSEEERKPFQAVIIARKSID